VYLGSTAGLAPSAGWSVLGDQAGAPFGSAVATAGDVNGHGFAPPLSARRALARSGPALR